jgi:hypothetical protein
MHPRLGRKPEASASAGRESQARGGRGLEIKRPVDLVQGQGRGGEPIGSSAEPMWSSIDQSSPTRCHSSHQRWSKRTGRISSMLGNER